MAAPPCVVCGRSTTGVCGDWCDECEGKPMCPICAEEHWEDLHG